MTFNTGLAVVLAFACSLSTARAQIPQPRPVSPRAAFTIGGKAYQAVFTSTDADTGMIVVVDAADTRRIVTLDQYDEVLAALADRRLEPLWPTILGWAGPDLGLVRARWLAAAKDRFARPATHVAIDGISEKDAARLRKDAEVRSYSRYRVYAQALFDAGAVSQAFAVLDRATELPPLASDRGFESGMMWIMRARFAWTMGDVAGALAAIEQGRVALGGATYAFAGNFDANAAYYLAASGQYSAALARIAQARSAKAPGAVRMGDLDLTGVEACALAGTGRAAEAAKAWQRLNDRADLGSKALERAIVCPADPGTTSRYFSRLLADQRLNDTTALKLQPGWRGAPIERSAIDAARRDPAVAGPFRATRRDLPPSLWPALNGWRP